MYLIMKIIVSAIVIGMVTEISRRFPSHGGILAALPLVSLLSIVWLHAQGEQTATLSKFVLGVIWGIPATVVFLAVIYIALQNSVHLFVSIGLGAGGWLLFLLVQNTIVKYAKVLFFSQQGG